MPLLRSIDDIPVSTNKGPTRNRRECAAGFLQSEKCGFSGKKAFIYTCGIVAVIKFPGSSGAIKSYFHELSDEMAV